MRKENIFYAQNVVKFLDMFPTDEEIEKVLKFSKAYTKLSVYEQQRINMFDFIRKNWYG